MIAIVTLIAILRILAPIIIAGVAVAFLYFYIKKQRENKKANQTEQENVTKIEEELDDIEESLNRMKDAEEQNEKVTTIWNDPQNKM